MDTKLEAEGRMFPASEKAESVWNTLIDYLREGKVTVRSNAEVTGFTIRKGEIAGVKLSDGKMIHGHAYILATGGSSRPETGSTGDGFKWLTKLGHSVRFPEPSLVPITTKEKWAHELAGLSHKEARVSIIQHDRLHGKAVGKILFTHVGMSGPLILNMSRNISELLKYGAVSLSIDLFPKMDNGMLDRHIQDVFKEAQNKLLKNVLGNIVPALLAKQLPTLLALDDAKEVNKVSKTERLTLVKFLKAIPLTVTGILGPEKAIVVSGGLSLTEIELKSMRSTLHQNLYVVGDILDIDRPSGGYSLQLCWTTGWVAGTHASGTVDA